MSALKENQIIFITKMKINELTFDMTSAAQVAQSVACGNCNKALRVRIPPATTGLSGRQGSSKVAFISGSHVV